MTKILYIFHKKCNFIFVMKTLADVKRKKEEERYEEETSINIDLVLLGDRVNAEIFINIINCKWF